MISESLILQLIPKPEGRQTVNFNDGSNQNIIDVIHANIGRAVKQVQKIAPYFQGKDAKETAKNIHDYLVNNIKYVNDGSEKQKIRLPSDLIHNKIGDCKSFTLFSCAILCALKYKNWTEYASYNAVDPTPTHVYSVAFAGNVPVYLDAVHTLFGGSFNTRKPPKYIKDYNMQISTISGTGKRINGTMIGCSNVSGTMIGGKAKDALKKVQTSVKKAASNVKGEVKKDTKKVQTSVKKAASNVKGEVKKDVKKLATAPKKVLKIGKKIVGAGPREAFKSLILLNYRGWANILNANLSDAVARWKQLGGDESVLKKAIASGMEKNPLLAGKNQKLKIKQLKGGNYAIQGLQTITGTMIGNIGSVAAILTAAAAVIAAFSAILNKGGGGVDVDNSDQPGESGSDGSILDQATNLFKAGADIVSQYTGGSGGSNTQTDSSATETASGSETATASEGGFFSKPLNVIGTGIALVLAGKAFKVF